MIEILDQIKAGLFLFTNPIILTKYISFLFFLLYMTTRFIKKTTASVASQNNINNFINFNVFLYLILLFLFVTNVPFVDDWMLLDPLNYEVNNLLPYIFEPFNGHSYVTTKALIYLLIYDGHLNLGLLSLISVILLWVCSLILKNSFFTQQYNNNYFHLSVLAILFWPKQVSNVSHLVNFAWLISLASIFMYVYFLKKASSKRYFFVFLAPLSFGLGIVVPIYEILISLRKYSKNLPAIIFSISSLLFSYVLPYLSLGQANIGSSNIPINVFVNLYAFLGNLASLFVLCHKIFSPVSFSIGAIQFALVATCFYKLYYKKEKKPLLLFIEKNPLLVMGLFFSFLISIKRAQFESMVASRYTTGNILFQIGFIYLIKDYLTKKIFELYTKAIFIFFFAAWFLPYQAIHWQALKSYRSDLIENCYKKANYNLAECNALTYNITFYNSSIWISSNDFKSLIDRLIQHKMIFLKGKG